MIRAILLMIGFALFSGTFAYAQQIGDEALQQVLEGKVSFLEGEFTAYLADTVSPGFVEMSLTEAGFEVASVDINPIQISIVNAPPDSTLERLKNHPSVLEHYLKYLIPDTAAIRSELKNYGFTEERIEQTIERHFTENPQKPLVIKFRYHINEDRMKRIMGNFRNVAYQIEQNYPKTANIKTEPGKELEVMSQIEKFPFVESTALIGVLKE